MTERGGSPTAKGAAGALVKEGLRLTIGLRAEPQQQAPASGKPQILSHRLGVVALHLPWGYRKGSLMPKLDGKTLPCSSPSGGRGCPGLL